jgi:pimeloyl-ACP methyl ester carboxylesterase
MTRAKAAKAMIFSLISISLAALALLFIALFLVQERLIFYPEKLPLDFQFRFTGPFAERWIDVDGIKLSSLLFKATEPKGVILFFHGNAGSLAGWGEVGAELAERAHWDAWVIDYPGYGKSEGRITSEEQLHGVADALWSAARREYGTAPIVAFGRSIGTGLAAELASRHEVAGLVLESPYLSLAALATQAFPWAPPFILRYRLRSDLWLAKARCPVLIFHGTSDEVIPFSQGKALAAVKPEAEFVPIEGGRHNDLGSYASYWQSLLRWLAERRPPQSTS